MFTKSARFYDALYGWKDYPAETAKLVTIVRERAPRARTLLDVACGTGKHLELLASHFEVEGLDLDPGLLAIARERLPGTPLHEADMRTFDLGRTFDVVTCLFSAIAYATTVEDLRAVTAAMARHLAPGGVLMVEPFFSRAEFEEGRVWATFVDEPDLKVARMDVPRVEGRVAHIEFRYLVGTPAGIEHFGEPHEIGLYTTEEHLAAFRAAGLAAEHEPEGLMGRGLFVAVKP